MTEPSIDLPIYHCAAEFRLPAGKAIVQHKHKRDHLSFLASGQVLLEVDGARSVLNAPACVNVVAGKHHGILALTNAVWFCIHPDSDTEGLISPPDDAEIARIGEGLLV